MIDYQRLLIIFAGHTSSGKTYAGEYLKENHGFYHVEASSIYRSLCQNERIDISKVTDHVNWMHTKHGYDFVEQKGLLPFINVYTKIVYTGARTMTGIERAKSFAENAGYHVVTIWVDCDDIVRYSRAVKRGRGGFNSFQDFQSTDNTECFKYFRKYGILLADYIIDNNQSVTSFIEKICRILEGTTQPYVPAKKLIDESLTEVDRVIYNNGSYISMPLRNELLQIKAILEMKK